ncbi:PaeR7I family type II restriction endonuclease [Kineococcus terrestris]|uniref:PaeR7I family type II restriction endonuclease n=1 Tax=Kineococcus terrestris TaxID=2044856 RepID=UPI0034DB10EE
MSLFWTKRADQIAALADGGAAGGAARAGGHMNGVRDLVASIFVEAGMPASAITYEPYLPGYYRVRKKWDLAVRYKGALVAALEFKSQVGSVGKNYNNRFEEALGTGADTWAAQRKNAAYGEVPPWLGYVFVLREDEETEKADRSTAALFPTDPDFDGLSYNGRYQQMISRFVGDNVYQAGWFITTSVGDDGVVRYAEPLATATGRSFRVAVQGRVDYVRSVLD